VKGHAVSFLLAIILSGCVAAVAAYITSYSEKSFVPGLYDYPTNQSQRRPSTGKTRTTNASDSSASNGAKQNASQADEYSRQQNNTGGDRSVWNVSLTDIVIAISATISAGIGVAILYVYRRMHSVMIEQGNIANRQANIANTQLVLAYRPKVIVRHIEMMDFKPEAPVAIRYTFVNKGETEAKLVEWSVDCTIVPPGANFSDRLPFHRTVPPYPPIVLGGGQPVQEDFIGLGAFGDNCTLVENGDAILLFYGVIAYRDGIGSTKRTGFVRRFDPKTGRFYLTDDPSNEYDD
jgi:hypothetical protein